MPRIHSIDYLKLIIASGIVWAHVMMLTQQGGAVDYVIGQGLVRTVVPTFAVISGFLFYSTLQRGKAVRWILQLTALYAFWWLAYLLEWLPYVGDRRTIILEAVFGPLHLWYVVALIMAVVMITVIHRLAGGGRTGRLVLVWSAVICLLIGTGLHSVHYFTDAHLSIHVYRNGPFLIFPYAVLGYLIADRLNRQGDGWMPSLQAGCLILLGLALLRLAEAGLALITFGASFEAPPEFPVLAVAFSAMFVLVALRVRLAEPPVNLAFLSMLIYFLHFMVVVTLLNFGITRVFVLTALGVAVPAVLGLGMLALAPVVAGLVPEGLARRMSIRDPAGRR
ncbi:acyltransferase family protein [Paragemmobacter ruber]|uniref:Acyltransferase family protein n=1 Tax=Paragemmobacter ruber TaxID=1985673 RepID=A0ABW9Y710_9RHOB|nr:acyltransferase [Rhodobacter ruber]NBE07595.1 acyltransferase family protein [Rhodobacter ruber]